MSKFSIAFVAITIGAGYWGAALLKAAQKRSDLARKVEIAIDPEVPEEELTERIVKIAQSMQINLEPKNLKLTYEEPFTTSMGNAVMIYNQRIIAEGAYEAKVALVKRRYEFKVQRTKQIKSKVIDRRLDQKELE